MFQLAAIQWWSQVVFLLRTMFFLDGRSLASQGPLIYSQWQRSQCLFMLLQSLDIPPLEGNSLVSVTGRLNGLHPHWSLNCPCQTWEAGSGVDFLMNDFIPWRPKQNTLWKQRVISLASWTQVTVLEEGSAPNALLPHGLSTTIWSPQREWYQVERAEWTHAVHQMGGPLPVGVPSEDRSEFWSCTLTIEPLKDTPCSWITRHSDEPEFKDNLPKSLNILSYEWSTFSALWQRKVGSDDDSWGQHHPPYPSSCCLFVCIVTTLVTVFCFFFMAGNQTWPHVSSLSLVLLSRLEVALLAAGCPLLCGSLLLLHWVTGKRLCNCWFPPSNFWLAAKKAGRSVLILFFFFLKARLIHRNCFKIQSKDTTPLHIPIHQQGKFITPPAQTLPSLQFWASRQLECKTAGSLHTRHLVFKVSLFLTYLSAVLEIFASFLPSFPPNLSLQSVSSLMVKS